MDFTDFQTGSDDEGRRLDKVIKILIPQLTLSNLYKGLRKGLIKINNSKTRHDYRIKAQDVISVASFLLETTAETEVKDNKNIKEIITFINTIKVFQNQHFLILNKPWGLNVQKAKSKDQALSDYVQLYYQECCKENSDSLSFKTGPLHRLDRMTSGLICFSMSLKGAQWFSEQMQQHTIKKTYQAIIEGQLKNEEVWKDYIEKDEGNNSDSFHKVKVFSAKEIEKASDKGALKECISCPKPIKSGFYKGIALTYAVFTIETGRQHQIRSQAAFHGYPLWGDSAYGGKPCPENEERFHLSACRIDFPENELGLPPFIKIESDPFIKKIAEKLESR